MICKHLFTGKDNVTFDIGRVLIFMGATTIILLTVYHVYITGQFDSIGFGTGYGGVLAGGGANLMMKSKTEPE